MAFTNRDNRHSDTSGFVESIKRAFSRVKTELDEHLDTINQNTTDIQEHNNMLAELESKIDKLAERIDDLELALNPQKAKASEIKLTPREQEVFMVLYINKFMSVKDISKRLGFTADMVNLYVMNLISKGVPVQKELMDDVLVFSIETDFKDLQARRNVLNIDSRIASQLIIQ